MKVKELTLKVAREAITQLICNFPSGYGLEYWIINVF